MTCLLSVICSAASRVLILAMLGATILGAVQSPTDPIVPSSNAANLTFGHIPQCYTPQEAPSAHATLEIDCILALYETLLFPHAEAPTDWHSVRPATSKYIARRIHGLCAITFGALESTSHELFPMMLVARQAAVVVADCMRERTGWRGGRSLLGPKGEYWLRVAWTDLLLEGNRTFTTNNVGTA